jgi:cell fate (sporulation/competence/biofilm development) regulator YmcA (YheA/YmcA/DUF963 family)
MGSKMSNNLSELKISEMENDISAALADIINLCNPPKDKMDEINDLVNSILGEISDLRNES